MDLWQNCAWHVVCNNIFIWFDLKVPVERRVMKMSLFFLLILDLLASGASDDVKYISKRNSGRMKAFYWLLSPDPLWYLLVQMFWFILFCHCKHLFSFFFPISGHSNDLQRTFAFFFSPSIASLAVSDVSWLETMAIGPLESDNLEQFLFFPLVLPFPLAKLKASSSSIFGSVVVTDQWHCCC